MNSISEGNILSCADSKGLKKSTASSFFGGSPRQGSGRHLGCSGNVNKKVHVRTYVTELPASSQIKYCACLQISERFLVRFLPLSRTLPRMPFLYFSNPMFCISFPFLFLYFSLFHCFAYLCSKQTLKLY